MFKKIFLASAFVGALAFGSFGTASTASADVCYGGRGFGGGPAFAYGGGYGRGFNSFSAYRGFDRGFGPRGYSYSRGFDRGFGYVPYSGYRNRGVSFRIGF